MAWLCFTQGSQIKWYTLPDPSLFRHTGRKVPIVVLKKDAAPFVLSVKSSIGMLRERLRPLYVSSNGEVPFSQWEEEFLLACKVEAKRVGVYVSAISSTMAKVLPSRYNAYRGQQLVKEKVVIVKADDLEAHEEWGVEEMVLGSDSS